MIKHSAVRSFQQVEKNAPDFIIHALGFERRSTAMLTSGAVPLGQVVSLLFPNERRLSFQSNVEAVRALGSELIEDYSTYLRTEFPLRIERFAEMNSRPPTVLIDVSSMNRTMIATVLFVVLSIKEKLRAVFLTYVPGQFADPRTEFPAIEQIGAVIPELSGFSADPELPIGVIMGLGYEYGLAVGLINRLEPRLTVCFRAIGHDVKYDDACRKANLDFDFGYSNIEVGTYPLLDPKSAYRHLENVVYGMVRSFRVVIVPLGPKLFAALATLLAIANIGTVAIWRVAARQEVADVVPSNEYLIVELDLTVQLPTIEMDRAINVYNGSELLIGP
jgi:hypothetical protein